MGSGAESLITEYGIGWPSPNNTGPMTDNSLTLDDDAPVQRLKGSNVIRVQSSERGDLACRPVCCGFDPPGDGTVLYTDRSRSRTSLQRACRI